MIEKLKFKSDISKSSSEPMFYKFFYKFCFSCIYIYIYIKMSKYSSAKYYKENKERLQKKLVSNIKIFLRKKRKKPQYVHERYKNLSEDGTNKLKYRKK